MRCLQSLRSAVEQLYDTLEVFILFINYTIDKKQSDSCNLKINLLFSTNTVKSVIEWGLLLKILRFCFRLQCKNTRTAMVEKLNICFFMHWYKLIFFT